MSERQQDRQCGSQPDAESQTQPKFITNAIIKSASITSDDHGLLSAWLHLEYRARGQGFGGFSLYLPKSFSHHTMLSPAGHFIWRCMEIADATEWSKLAGKAIRVRKSDEWGLIEAIGHIVKDDWFCPQVDFAAMKGESNDSH